MTNEPLTKYIIDNSVVVPVVQVNEEWLVPANTLFNKKDNIVYNSKLDAQYFLMLSNLKKGKSLENYRSSKYYKYYIDRLKDENPEFMI